MNLWSERCKAFKNTPQDHYRPSVCVCDANEAGRAAVCPGLISVLCGAACMRGEVKWGVINLNEVQLFSHLLIIAG